MTGWRLTSSMPAMMRCLSSCFDVTRIWRRTERANLEKKPSIRPRQSRQCFNLLSGHRQRDRLPPSCHDAAPRSINHKRGIRQQITRSMISFMESIV